MDVYLYGCGGHAKVILDILRLQGKRVKALADDAPRSGVIDICGVPVRSATEVLASVSPDLATWIVAIGDNMARRRVAGKLENLGYGFTTAIHPSAQIGSEVTIDAGAVVMANTAINFGSHIGRHAIVNTSASIDHECWVGEYSHIAPGCALCGAVKIGEGVLLGVGCCVTPGVEIGRGTICGAGSAVITSLPSDCLAYGSPAKVVQNLLLKS